MKHDLMAQGMKLKNNLMCLLIKPRVKNKVNYTTSAPLKVWHERLGHVNCDSINKMVKNDVALGLKIDLKDKFYCDNCPFGKQFKLPFPAKKN